MAHCILRLVVFGTCVSFALGLTQGTVTETPQEPPSTGITVPMFPNTTCPIMGKPASTKLFAETEKGRIYICCKSCVKDILADVDTAYRCRCA